MYHSERINRVTIDPDLLGNSLQTNVTDVPVFREFIKATRAYVYVTSRDAL